MRKTSDLSFMGGDRQLSSSEHNDISRMPNMTSSVCQHARNRESSEMPGWENVRGYILGPIARATWQDVASVRGEGYDIADGMIIRGRWITLEIDI